MNKKLILFLTILALLLVLLGIFFVYKNYTTARNSTPKIIEISVVRGDEIEDPRSPDEACDSIIEEVKSSNLYKDCKLIYSEKVDYPFDKSKCVDAASLAGCFYCKFECR